MIKEIKVIKYLIEEIEEAENAIKESSELEIKIKEEEKVKYIDCKLREKYNFDYNEIYRSTALIKQNSKKIRKLLLKLY